MRKQHPQAPRPMQYEDNTWISSLSKPPRFKDPDITFSRKLITDLAHSIYETNVTESCYIWNFGYNSGNIRAVST